MVFNWSLSFSFSAYRLLVMRCLLLILFVVKIKDREFLRLSFGVDTKHWTYKRMDIRIASRGFLVEHYKEPGSRTLEFEPVGFRRGKRIKLVRENIYPVPA